MRCKLFLLGILALFFSCSFAAPQSFEAFVAELKQQALQKGFSKNVVDEAFKTIKQLHRVVHKDKNQPEQQRTFKYYEATTVTARRIAKAQQLQQQHKSLLAELQKKYQVPSAYLLALWGLETNFGHYTGQYPEFSALATLAYDQRRRAFFTKEFFAALTMVQKGYAKPNEMLGSWAGAMGQSQFMPRTYLSYAVDYDADGQADIWHSVPDVLASIANYLHSEGFNPAHPQVVFPVTLSKTIPTELVGLKIAKSVTQWHQLGVKSVIPRNDPGLWSLMQPDGQHGVSFLVNRHNFRVIKRWNASQYYALVVGLLANKIGI